MGEKFAHVGKKFAHIINLSLFSYEVRESKSVILDHESQVS